MSAAELDCKFCGRPTRAADRFCPACGGYLEGEVLPPLFQHMGKLNRWGEIIVCLLAALLVLGFLLGNFADAIISFIRDEWFLDQIMEPQGQRNFRLVIFFVFGVPQLLFLIPGLILFAKLRCPACKYFWGDFFRPDYHFCDNCGTRIKAGKKEILFAAALGESSDGPCAVCGAAAAVADCFCGQCGANLGASLYPLPRRAQPGFHREMREQRKCPGCGYRRIFPYLTSCGSFPYLALRDFRFCPKCGYNQEYAGGG